MAAMSRVLHVCLDVKGALRWSTSQLRGMLSRPDGSRATTDEVREYLLEQLAQGRRVLPMADDCEGFSYETGCPGHEDAAAATPTHDEKERDG
jgi:hypothetical protein